MVKLPFFITKEKVQSEMKYIWRDFMVPCRSLLISIIKNKTNAVFIFKSRTEAPPSD
jgi:hypothetical protein